MLFRKRKPSGRRRPQPSPVPTAEEAAKAELAIVEPPPPVATAGPPEAEAGGVLTIDCAAIAHNWRTLASHAAPAECAAVVKADAYGCGVEPVTRALVAAGCTTFFVAHLSEARRVRTIAPNAALYVLNGVAPGTAPAFAEIDARPVIGNLAELAEWDAFRRAGGWPGGAALHFETGMNRLGLAAEEASALAQRTRTAEHGIALVTSHLACADEPDHPLNARQIEAFRDIRLMFRGIPASLANSAGIFLGPAAHFDLVRPGLALYGGCPTTGPNPMRPVVELKGRILQIRAVANGATVGYGATWTARRATRLAVVAIGYADGYPRPVSWSDTRRGGEAIVAGRRCPVVGRVSMDMTAVDITDVPDPVRRGDFVTLLGGDIGIDDLAGWGHTISYDVLTRLGQRFHRVWTM